MKCFHNRKDIGSTKIRVHNLIKYWDEAELYKYGQKADVLIFQKVYCTYDYKLPAHYPGITILDICDPDWTNTPDIHIAETVRSVDAVVTPTETMRDFLAQMTDKPVRVIKDRFDLSEFPKPKHHVGNVKTVVWFGYSHNSELIRFAVPSIEKRGLNLMVISNHDPEAYRWANDSVSYKDKYQFIKYDQKTIYTDLQKADICILPKGYRPFDRFKSENKTIISELCGVPVANFAEEIDSLISAKQRNEHVNANYDIIREEYDCRKSVSEYKELIGKLRGN